MWWFQAAEAACSRGAPNDELTTPQRGANVHGNFRPRCRTATTMLDEDHEEGARQERTYGQGEVNGNRSR